MRLSDKQRDIIIILVVTFGLALFCGNIAEANGLVPCKDQCTLCHIVIGFHNIFTWLLGILFTACVAGIMAAGVLYMVSSGSTKLIEKAKQALTYALLAFTLALCAWLIVTIVLRAFNFKNKDSWWTFTCDTTVSQPPGPGPGPGPGPEPGEEGNCGGMRTSVPEQCKLASKDLQALLNCMSSKGAPGTITSVTASNVGGDLNKSYACCGNPSCIHATYTCHYGCGLADQGYSHAVDIGTGGWSDSQLCQLASIAKECGSGRIWGPKNMSCGIKFQPGHNTHLHISTAACNH